MINITECLSCGELDHHRLNANRGYVEALCWLSNQLGCSSGGKKLVFTLSIAKKSPVPDGILPGSSGAGDLKIMKWRRMRGLKVRRLGYILGKLRFVHNSTGMYSNVLENKAISFYRVGVHNIRTSSLPRTRRAWCDAVRE